MTASDLPPDGAPSPAPDLACRGSRRAVLCLGRIYCDLIFSGAPSLPQLGREVFADDLTITAGGGALITAAHLARLGRPTALVARLGHDGLSTFIAPLIEQTGADLRFLERSADAGPQATAAVVLGDERAFLSRRAGSARPAILGEALAWPEAAHLHIAEYATLHEMPDLIAQAKDAGLTISLDPSWDEQLIHSPELLARSRGVDIFFPNLEEARAITGRDDPQAALQDLAKHFPIVALKAGGDGAWLAAHGKISHSPAPVVDAVDTTGAGDAFNAGFLAAALSGAPSSACVERGVFQASLSVRTMGGLPMPQLSHAIISRCAGC